MSVFVVAECGVNWVAIESDKLRMAKKMIETFKECGADACKFQMYKEYHVAAHPRKDELQAIVLSEDDAKALREHGDGVGIDVFFTPMYVEAVNILERIHVNRYKIRSRDAVNVDLLKAVMATNKDMMVSVANNRVDWDVLCTPGSDGKELRYRVKLLYCIEHYPTEDEEVDLTGAFPAMRRYQSSIEYAGLSDHTTGITCPIAAVAMGAKVIEKHVKLDNKYEWVDNAVAITPTEFKEMVYHIRRVEAMR